MRPSFYATVYLNTKNGIIDACSTVDCSPLLSIVIHFCPLLSIVFHRYPLLSIVIHCWPLLSIVVQCCPLLPILSIVVYCCPLLSIVFHCCPLLSIVVIRYPLLSNFDNDNDNDNPRDLWPLRHWLQLWQYGNDKIPLNCVCLCQTYGPICLIGTKNWEADWVGWGAQILDEISSTKLIANPPGSQ